MRFSTQKSQQGLTFIGLIFTIFLIVFFAVLGMSLFPPYLQHFTIKHALEELAPQAKGSTNRKQLVESLSRKFQVDNIKVPANALQIEKKDKEMWLVLKYETRVHVMGNVDAVVMFNERVPVK